MIGIMITGHGEFAQGMYHATKMIAGEQGNYQEILFRDGMNLEDYQADLKNALDRFLEEYDGALIFTDLKGGTPFNISVLLSNDYDNVEVVSGANLPMLVEASMQSQFVDSPKELAELLLATGRDGIERADLSVDEESDEPEGDGI